MTSAITLTLACVAIVAFQVLASRLDAVEDLASLAHILAASCQEPLAFRDAKAAEAVLASLRTNREILSARIYQSDGSVFAQYVAADKNMPALPRERLVEGHWFQQRQLTFVHRINLGGELIGTIVLRSDMREQYTRLRDYVTIVTILMLASTCVAFLLSAKLQDVISGPVLELVHMARGVTENKDYSLRARGRRDGEIGQLVEAFNHMLDRIQERDNALRKT